MRVFRQFDNTNNRLEIIEVSTNNIGYEFKISRYILNRSGCYNKLGYTTCNISYDDRKKCLEREKADEDWNIGIVQ